MRVPASWERLDSRRPFLSTGVSLIGISDRRPRCFSAQSIRPLHLSALHYLRSSRLLAQTAHEDCCPLSAVDPQKCRRRDDIAIYDQSCPRNHLRPNAAHPRVPPYRQRPHRARPMRYRRLHIPPRTVRARVKPVSASRYGSFVYPRRTTSVRMPTPAFCYATPPPFVASVVPLRGPARSNTSRPPRSGCLRSLMTPAPDCSVSTAPWRLGPCIRLHCPLSHRSAAACDDERAAARLLSCRRDLLPRILITPYRLLTHLHLPACSTSASGPLPDEAPPLKPTESPLGCLSSTARHVIAILTHRNLYTSFRLQPPARRRASGHDDRGVPSSTAFPCISASVYTRLLRHPLSSSPAASMHADRRPHLHGLLFLMLACMRLRYQASAPRSSSCKAPLPQIIPPPPPR